MPTGYTATLYEGKEQTLPEFVMSCARAFGALITMRDDPADAPIPDEFTPSDYHAAELVKAERQLSRLTDISDEDAQRQADEDHRKAHEAWVESKARSAAIRERYEAMLAQVQTWEPPTADHVELKDFMVKQLTESIDFDCSDSDRFFPEPQPKTVEEWKSERLTRAHRDVARHREEHAKEVERAQARTEWVRALRGSLGVRI